MEKYINSNVEELEKRLGTKWPNLQKARIQTSKTISSIEGFLPSILLSSPFRSDEMSLIVFGSLARKEFTKGSDIDWTFLIDGQTNSKHMDAALAFKETMRGKFNEPGKEGTFGGLTFSHEIIHNIGGDHDTNRNTTRRILLLLESKSIGNGNAHKRVIDGILNRYIIEDSRPKMPSKDRLPRFLLNDIVRYWRTMAVDFGYKRRERNWEGAALRIIKLRISRKLIYASGLLACFACETDKNLEGKYSKADYSEKHKLISKYLNKLFGQTPLDLFASIILSHDENLHEPARRIFGSYDKFLGLLSIKKNRKHLKNLKQDQVDSDELYEELRMICDCFQEGLDGIFFNEKNGTGFFGLIKKYGVF